MTDLNEVIPMGRLARAPELKKIGESGFSVIEFTLAVNRSYLKDGDWVDKTSYIDCKAFGEMAEKRFQADWMTKGNPVVVTGRMEQDRWERDGQKFSKISVIADTIKQPLKPKNNDKESPEAMPEAETPTDDNLYADSTSLPIF